MLNSFSKGSKNKQSKGGTMGLPVSPIVSNVYMEEFENRALNTTDHPPRIWKRYVDYTLLTQDSQHKDKFLQHINSKDKAIEFIVEDNRSVGAMPFVDIIIAPTPEGTLTTGVYRKPTHRDQYLQWDGHHNITAKYSVTNTLTHRLKTVCSTPELLGKEIQHLWEAIQIQISQMGTQKDTQQEPET